MATTYTDAQKRQAVRQLRTQGVTLLARAFGVTNKTLYNWRDKFAAEAKARRTPKPKAKATTTLRKAKTAGRAKSKH